MQKSNFRTLTKSCATPPGSVGSCARRPGVSLRSTPGYSLPSLPGWREGNPEGLPDSSRRSEQRGDLRTTIEIKRHPDGVPENRAECARDAPPQQLDGQEPFLETSAGVRATPSGSAGSCVPCPGGIAALNPRLLSAIPAGWGSATRKGCQTVAGGRSNAETSGQRFKSIRHPDGVPENRAECARDAPPQQLDGQEPFLETSAGVRATPSGSAGSCVPCPGGIAALNPRLLSAIPCGMGSCDPSGVGGFLCAVSGGIAALNPRLLSAIPAGMGGRQPARVARQ